ncbi:MAG: bifunctional proline dehydrogenase/L-glutamate gamma-semialdehyde dehydrogenase PutA [Oceanobacter sp.]
MLFSDADTLKRPLPEPDPEVWRDVVTRQSPLQPDEQALVGAIGSRLIRQLQQDNHFSLLERFLSRVGLESAEGQALMVLSESLLRVPDTQTQTALLSDCLDACDWQRLSAMASDHDGMNLFSLGGRLLPLMACWHASSDGGLGRAFMRRSARYGVRLLGQQFVIGADIESALDRAKRKSAYDYSFDMLGEAALTAQDAERYFVAYQQAIETAGRQARSDRVVENPSISIKLSALSPVYRRLQRQRVLDEVVPRVSMLAQLASRYQLGLTLDAEESDRLELQLDVLEGVLQYLQRRVPSGWSGLGIAVQAYGLRVGHVIEWLYRASGVYGRPLSVRLVKGAYWDSEIKRAQILGSRHYPVLTDKSVTDQAYLHCAGQLFQRADRLYPQFATHNAYTVAAVHALSLRYPMVQWEYQRLYGMGESLYDRVLSDSDFCTGYGDRPRCRVYAPVGPSDQLLAYLVRRLLENGANTSFVHQLVSHQCAPPLADYPSLCPLPEPADLYGNRRRNARGLDVGCEADLTWVEEARIPYRDHCWDFTHSSRVTASGARLSVTNPAHWDECVGQTLQSTEADVQGAVVRATAAQPDWQRWPVTERMACLQRYADLLEQHTPELLALLCREAGKTLMDAVNEIREAVDFARYYASQVEHALHIGLTAHGTVACISPWNFPLAILSGPVLAALVCGNSVVAKPAEQTPLIACRAVALMHQAGIPEDVLQLVIGPGESVGAWLLQQPVIRGVCFTGSLATARIIHQQVSHTLPPDTPLIAETGGINAMIVDSTALPEQVVQDVMVSAFQSAGQRCSALRVLYLQQDIAEAVIDRLLGALAEWHVGDAWSLDVDQGPVIDGEAYRQVQAYLQQAEEEGRLLTPATLSSMPESGWFIAPAVIRVDDIASIEREVFGPVLHVATFAAAELDAVVDAINATGYGLTFALHTRIRERAVSVASRMRVGNCYINRNQVGAVVGVQPFGGEGLSGTGPKAGGPHYLSRFLRPYRVAGAVSVSPPSAVSPASVKEAELQQHLDALTGSSMRSSEQLAEQLQPLAIMLDQAVPDTWHDALPEILAGPTGESNVLRQYPRGKVVCMAEKIKPALMLAMVALRAGNSVVLVVGESVPAAVGETLVAADLPIQWISGFMEPDVLRDVSDVALVSVSRDLGEGYLRRVRCALALRSGALVTLLVDDRNPRHYQLERHVCTNLTAAGGNIQLLSRGWQQ